MWVLMAVVWHARPPAPMQDACLPACALPPSLPLPRPAPVLLGWVWAWGLCRRFCRIAAQVFPLDCRRKPRAPASALPWVPACRPTLAEVGHLMSWQYPVATIVAAIAGAATYAVVREFANFRLRERQPRERGIEFALLRIRW